MSNRMKDLTGIYVKEMMENCFKMELDTRKFYNKMKKYRKKYFSLKRENRKLKEQVEMLKNQIK